MNHFLETKLTNSDDDYDNEEDGALNFNPSNENLNNKSKSREKGKLNHQVEITRKENNKVIPSKKSQFDEVSKISKNQSKIAEYVDLEDSDDQSQHDNQTSNDKTINQTNEDFFELNNSRISEIQSHHLDQNRISNTDKKDKKVFNHHIYNNHKVSNTDNKTKEINKTNTKKKMYKRPKKNATCD